MSTAEIPRIEPEERALAIAQSEQSSASAKLSGAAESVKTWVREAGTETRDAARLGYRKTVHAAKSAVRQIGSGAKRMRDDHPAQLIGIIAAAAFLIGVATAWRLRRS